MPWINVVFNIVVLLIGLFILGKSAKFVVTAVSRIGHFLRISQFITGFVILGIATSTPEIFVALNASWSNTPQLSLGNLLGANIVLLTLIAGLTAVMAGGITLKQELSHKGRLMQIALVILAPLVLIVDSHLSRWDGIFLALLYIGYTVYLYYKRPKDSPPLAHPITNDKMFHTLFLFVVGLIGVVLSSKAVVSSSLTIADFVHLPPVIVGILILSLGTNLPELSLIFAAIKHHHTNLVIGDVLGSAATNTLIVAMLGVMSPFDMHSIESFEATAIFMAAALVTFFFLTKSKNQLSVREGLLLLTFYIGFVVSQIALLYLF
jgi:cation:H+ antiporter